MKTSTFLSGGARQVFRLRKLIGLFYLANLAAAAILVVPVAVGIRRQLAHSQESERLFSNFDLAWASEMFFQHGSLPLAAFGATAAVVLLLFLVLNTFFAGGAIAVFHRESDSFFAAAARYFPRLLRLLLIAVVFYGLVIALNGGITALLNRLSENSMEARPWVVLNWARLLIILFLFGTVNMIFDYAKIVSVVEDKRSAMKSAVSGLRFVSANPRRTLAIYWMCSLIGVLFLLGYHGLSELIGQNTAAAVIVLFLVRQVYVLTRMWTRLWTWSSEVAYYSVSRQTLSSTIVAPEPPSLAVAG